MGLIGIIYNDCLTVKHGTFDESAALTLMSSDADDAASCASLFHETWSQVLELSIGMYLLAEELGWVCVIPPLVILGKLQTHCRLARVDNTDDAVLTCTRCLEDSRIGHRECCVSANCV